MSQRANSSRTSRPWLISLALLAGFVAIGLGGWLAGRVLRNADWSVKVTQPDWPWLIAVGLVAIVATLCLHELGHLIGGWLVGFRFTLFIAGPLKIVREGEAIRVHLNKDLSLYGGLAGAMPRDDRDLRRRMAVMVAAGPLTSLLLGIVSLGVAAWAGVSEAWGVFAFFWGVFGLLNLALCVVTLIPGKTSGFDTDGAQLLDALRGGHGAERRWLTVALTADSMDGRRPRDWNAAHVKRLLALRENTEADVLANLLGYYHWLDHGDVQRAGELMAQSVAQHAGLPQAARPALFAEAAYYAARHRADAVEARASLEKARGGMLDTHTRQRAEAAVLLVEGKTVEAAEKARAALAELSRSADKGGAVAEREWLQAIVQAAQRV